MLGARHNVVGYLALVYLIIGIFSSYAREYAVQKSLIINNGCFFYYLD